VDVGPFIRIRDSGWKPVDKFCEITPRIAVLILTIMDAEWVGQAGRDVGARRYFLKSEAARVMVGALKAPQHGRVADCITSSNLRTRFYAASRSVDTLGRRLPRPHLFFGEASFLSRSTAVLAVGGPTDVRSGRTSPDDPDRPAPDQKYAACSVPR